jgi:spore coat protein U-like protein
MKQHSILLKSLLLLGALAMLAIGASAQARVTCTISSPGFATAYPMSGGVLNITATNFTVTCTNNRNRARTVTYQVGVNDGVNAVGTQNRARRGGSRINYDLYSDLGCTNQWQNSAVNNRIPNPAVTFTLTRGAPDVRTFSFYGCVPAGLTVPAAGTYTDTVTMTFSGSVSGGGITFTGGTIPVSITAPASCTFSQQPGNLVFNYASFSATDVLANTSFRTTCTNLLPYSVALNVASGVVTGLNYTLALNTTANTGGVNPLASRGNGVAQTFYVNGSIVAGQSGTCAAGVCTGTQAHSLIITY